MSYWVEVGKKLSITKISTNVEISKRGSRK